MKEIDARGLSCPQPVIMAAQAISSGEFPFVILVDTAAACENVTRISVKKGCTVESSETGCLESSTGAGSGSFRLVIDKSAEDKK